MLGGILDKPVFLFWLLSLLCGASLCQNFKNSFVILITVVIVAASIVFFFRNKLYSYKKRVSRFKARLTCEMIAMIVVTCFHMIAAIFVFDQNDGVYCLVYLIYVIPLAPIVIHTLRMNASR